MPALSMDNGQREPRAGGLIAVITPWNFPMSIPAWKIAPALAYGNTVILKPGELTPGCAWALPDVLRRAGTCGRIQHGHINPDECSRLLDVAAKSKDPFERLARNRAAAERLLALTRKRGFALSDQEFLPANRGADVVCDQPYCLDLADHYR